MIIIKRIAATATEHTGDKLRKQSCLNRCSFKYRVTSWFLFAVINTSSVWEKILKCAIYSRRISTTRTTETGSSSMLHVIASYYSHSPGDTHLNQSAGITGLTGRVLTFKATEVYFLIMRAAWSFGSARETPSTPVTGQLNVC